MRIICNFSCFHLLSIVILINGIVSSSAQASCSGEHFQQCSMKLRPLMERSNLSFGYNDADIDAGCKPFTESMTCVMDYVHRCATPEQKLQLMATFQGIQSYLTDLCTPGSSFRESIKKHGKCYESATDTQERCIKNAKSEEAALSSEDVPPEDKLPRSCCLVVNTNNCVRNGILRECGEEAADVMHGAYQKIVSPILNECTRLKLDLSKCGASSTTSIFLMIFLFAAAVIFRR